MDSEATGGRLFIKEETDRLNENDTDSLIDQDYFEDIGHPFIPEDIFIKHYEEDDVIDEENVCGNDKDDASVPIENGAKKRRLWVDPNNLNRHEGEFALMFKDLISNEEEFKKHYGLSYSKFKTLLEIIRPWIQKADTNMRLAIIPEERLALTLRFLTTGFTFTKIASDYKVGSCTVKNIIFTVTCTISNRLPSYVMTRPNMQKWQSYEKEFSEKYLLPNCIGILDGREIKISCNKGTTFSLVILAMIDATAKFVIVNVGGFEKVSNGGFSTHNSMLGKLLENNDLLQSPPDKPFFEGGKPQPHYFITNNIFSLRTNILKPYPRRYDTEDNRKFNKHLRNALEPAEQAFKMLLHYFQYFQTKIILKPEYVKHLILASCCLHNFLMDERGIDHLKMTGLSKWVQKVPPVMGSISKNVKHVRDNLKEYICNTD